MWQWLETELTQLELIQYRMLLFFMAAVSAFMFFRIYRSFHRSRFMAGTATSRVRSAPQGYVELKGLGEWMPNGEIYSPFSGARCLWYHCTTEKRSGDDKSSNWTNISSQKSDSLFHLVDDTGVCIIDPEDAIIYPELKRRWLGKGLEDQNQPPKSAARWHSGVVGFNRDYRFHEKLITPATEIYAIGNFKTHRLEASESLINKQVGELLREWKLKPGKYLTQFNLDNNGEIEKQEWDKIRQAARRQVMSENSKQFQPQNVMSKPSNSKQPFIISAISEETLMGEKKKKSMATLITAIVLFCAALLCVTIRSPFTG